MVQGKTSTETNPRNKKARSDFLPRNILRRELHGHPFKKGNYVE